MQRLMQNMLCNALMASKNLIIERQEMGPQISQCCKGSMEPVAPSALLTLSAKRKRTSEDELLS